MCYSLRFLFRSDSFANSALMPQTQPPAASLPSYRCSPHLSLRFPPLNDYFYLTDIEINSINYYFIY